MSQAQMLRKHHRSLLEMAHELEKGLAALDIQERRQHIVHSLSRMTGLLALHLAMEDRVLYPLLQSRTAFDAAEMSRLCFAEVGGFKDSFDAYRRRWMRPAAFEAAWEEFAVDTRAMLGALRDRIHRENREIYDLMETLGM